MTDNTEGIDSDDPLMEVLSDSVLYGMEKKKSLSIQPPVRPPFYRVFSYFNYLKALKVYRFLKIQELKENKEVQTILSTLDSNRDMMKPILEGNKLSSRLKGYLSGKFKKTI